MRVLYGSRQNSITLTKELKSSGEGIIYFTSIQGCMAKIYHRPSPQYEKKLIAMINRPAENTTARLNHISLAWPQDILRDSSGNFRGFLMPIIKEPVEINKVISSKIRRDEYPQFNWRYLHSTAKHFASIVEALHSKQYIIGDIKPQNILVNSQALVSIVDTDSFQIYDPITSKTFMCPVGSSEYTPPEMIGKDFENTPRSINNDLFGLGVVIYQLLFFEHPFRGIWNGSSPVDVPDERIKMGHWAHGKGSLVVPAPSSIPINIIHPDLEKLFHRCFTDGHQSPKLRPSAADWRKVLAQAESQLLNCSQDRNHLYGRHSASCYWCQSKIKLKKDVYFPTPISPNQLPKNTTTIFPKTHPLSPNSSTIAPSRSLNSPATISPTIANLPLRQNSNHPVSTQWKKANSSVQSVVKTIGAIVLFGITINILRSCMPSSPLPTVQKAPPPESVELPVSPSPVVPPVKPIKQVRTTNLSSSSSFSFPMSSCGDSGNPDDGTWYPVFARTSKTSLEIIKRELCGDAFIKYRDTVNRKDIQIASFRSKEKAEKLAKAVQEKLNTGEVGNPSP
jgi:DNA-binding helix-hairpin-helix protein with protein kinase domain